MFSPSSFAEWTPLVPGAELHKALAKQLTSTKRVRFDTEAEYKLAAESSTRVIARVYDYSKSVAWLAWHVPPAPGL